jgi:hypothetical protein
MRLFASGNKRIVAGRWLAGHDVIMAPPGLISAAATRYPGGTHV